MDSYRTMQSMRLLGVVLVTATCVGFHSSTARADDTTAWSTSATACVPVNTSGLSVTPVAVTAAAGVTVTLNCAITTRPGGFNSIEITYMGGGFVLPPLLARAQSSTSQSSTDDVNTMALVILRGGVVTSELVETSKATGVETANKCVIQAKGSPTIATEVNGCSNSAMDFNKNFYSLRIVLKSGITTGSQMTVYGSSLVLH